MFTDISVSMCGLSDNTFKVFETLKDNGGSLDFFVNPMDNSVTFVSTIFEDEDMGDFYEH
ncbi:hypothetical protein [Evtepia gabavorous]|uniref:hypothetical protein n=1 Tax=Evtepia gabavorous TaxID=2211183 RepID=UPI00399A2A00